MHPEREIVIRIDRRTFAVVAALFVLAVAFLGFPGYSRAQKVQEKYSEKFNIAENNGGVAVSTSSDGKYVYVAGPQGVIVSDDYGKTGTWVQTVRLK